jgi:predicted outer membrane repeat protein
MARNSFFPRKPGIIHFMVMLSLLIAVVLPAGRTALSFPLAPIAPTAVTAATWYNGMIQYSSITNCASIIQGFPYQEDGAAAYTGFQANPDAGQPAPNTIYLVHVFIAGMGNSRSGIRAYVEVALPANTSLAIDSINHVSCFYDNAPITPASACPQSLPPSTVNPGAYAVWSTDNAHAYTWPLPQGHTLEIQIPVRSSIALSNSTLQANVWMLDGNSSPWLRPQEGVYVFSSQPTIIYNSPSTTSMTTTSAYSQAYLYKDGATGTGQFDLGTTTGYTLRHDGPITIGAGTAYLAWDDWVPPPFPILTPDTLYHWRFQFTPSGGSTIYGADQTFRTLPDGRVTVGSGITASCDETALITALSTAKEILFECGTLPTTITLTGVRSITSNVTINGGNKVTLDANGASNHFNVQSGAHLTLTQITLINGKNTTDCGGSINVLAGGLLSLNGARFDGNMSKLQGGAICNWGDTDITTTLFTKNASLASHGGAIGNYGTLTIADSKFISNTASFNGGAIDMGGTVSVTHSAFTTNTGLRGGGINTYGGSLTVTDSSFTSNTANAWGGGLANDASVTTVTGSTFSDNNAGFGGGLETSGVGSLILTNNTISANHAATDGGGLYWYPGVSTGPITILNTTFASNVAVGQGGNIYAGGAANPAIHLKNTLVASGSPNNCDNPIGSQGNNLESANTCGLTAAGDIINADPTLGPLQDNGGGTLTQALPFGSPAIDAGTDTGCPLTDQRGVARPIDGNGDGAAVCDIGAFEAKKGATVTLTGLSQTYNNTPRPIGATTNPPGLTVTFDYNGQSVAPTLAGSFPVSATISDANYAGFASGTLIIAPAASAIQLVSSLNPAIKGQAVTFTATVSTAQGLPAPPGTVIFTIAGVDQPAVTLDGTGAATLTSGTLPGGSSQVSASYPGGANYAASGPASLNQTVNFKVYLPITQH